MPARFRFRLEALLRIRQVREDEEAILLGRATALVTERANALAALEGAHQDSLEDIVEGQREGTATLEAMLDSGRYRQALVRAAAGARTALEESRREEAVARARYAEARKQREILGKLRQDQYEAYLRGLDAAEARMLDELATQAHARRDGKGRISR